jgi:hypothetical protein
MRPIGSGDCPDRPRREIRCGNSTELLVDPVCKAQSPGVPRRKWRLRFLAWLSKKLRSSLLAPSRTLAQRDSRPYRSRGMLILAPMGFSPGSRSAKSALKVAPRRVFRLLACYSIPRPTSGAAFRALLLTAKPRVKTRGVLYSRFAAKSDSPVREKSAIAYRYYWLCDGEPKASDRVGR